MLLIVAVRVHSDVGVDAPVAARKNADVMDEDALRLTGGGFAAIVGGTTPPEFSATAMVEAASIDSRHVPRNAAFFALPGSEHDGHEFVERALAAGASLAVIRSDQLQKFSTAIVPRLVAVPQPLLALQAFASWWRTELATTTFIGVTGSNGKTVVKDALINLLNSAGLLAAGSPGSFNSQSGVPLSILSVPRAAKYAVIEAGISEPGEMRALEAMIRPDIGILTNIGLAHISAFSGDRAELAKEKFRLFHNITRGDVVVPVGDPVVAAEAVTLRCRVHHFGERGDLPFIESHDPTRDGIRVHLRYPNSEIATFLVRTPSVENARTVAIAAAAASLLGVGAKKAESALDGWEPGSTRMEMWRSPSGITIINDSCSADPLSVRVAIDALSKWDPNGPHRTFFVFHGIRGVAETENVDIGRIAAKAKIDVFVPVEYDGSEATEAAFRENGGGMVIRCHQIEDVRSKVVPELRSGDVVLVKGPRRWGIAHAASVLVESMAPNRFIIDLEVLRENIRRFGGGLRPATRILAVVKALAYGSDGSRVAADLQREGLVSHFGVASADEGVALRAAGIVRPILVFMCTPDEARKAIQHTLTPVVYSKEIADHVERAAESLQTQVAVHIEVDTGMGRLGELPEDVPALATRIVNSPWLKLEGLMTHFASADDPTQDDFTERQIQLFDETIAGLREIGITGLLCHANATAASARFPNAQYDMVRLGLGIYGIYPSDAVRDAIDDLQLAIALVSRIAEIRVLPHGHEIGYSRTFMVPHDDFRVGIVPIGYHDGIPWRLGTSGKGCVLVNGKPAAILGRISMDSMVIDLSTQPEATPGMDVLIFGRYGGYELRPEAVAASCDTIAHELLVRIGPRVQRIFVGDSA